jgi:transposase-like protein
MDSELYSTKARNDIIAERVRNGESYATIGRELGITRERVRQIVKKYGVTAIRGTKVKEYLEAAQRRREELAALVRPIIDSLRHEIEVNGLSINAAEEKLGLCRGRAGRLVNKNGIRSRHKSGNPKFRGRHG